MKSSTTVLVEKNRKLLSIDNQLNKYLSKKALYSAFFCAISITGTTAAFSSTIQNCSAQQFDETATVKYVHDGDTIRLSDKRKVRLIGIDTPELARKGRPEQPYAADAKKALKTLLADNKNRVNLVYGKEKKDRYGRTLAHLYLDNGSNVQAELISRGLAIAFTTPPNTRLSDCYSSVEASSRLSRRGIWSHQKYQPLKTTNLSTVTKGFHIVEDTVKKIRINPKTIWINLENKLNVQIRGKDRHYFDIKSVQCLAGKSIQIRGWLHPKKVGAYMSLRHPSALHIMGDKVCN